MGDKVYDDWKFSSIGGYFQVIFFFLELSERAFISLQDFIDYFGLDVVF